MRSRFQGVTNIVRFNWPFFGFALLVALFALAGAMWLRAPLHFFALAILLGTLGGVGVSLFVSWWVYDRSELYSMPWLNEGSDPDLMVNINAGFDETSVLLRQRFARAELRVWDFFNAARHTEASIQRARMAYPPDEATLVVATDLLPLDENSADVVCLFMAAHEVRQHAERVDFFREIARILQPSGKVFVTEHLRDAPNALAYTLGALHFHSRKTWLETFERAGLLMLEERKVTPFVSTFVLAKGEA